MVEFVLVKKKYKKTSTQPGASLWANWHLNVNNPNGASNFMKVQIESLLNPLQVAKHQWLIFDSC